MDAVRWDKFLPQIAGAMRSTVNRSTGFTPNMLMLGREINQPADLMFPLPPKPRCRDSVDEYCTDLTQAIETAHEIARSTLQSTQRRMKRDYDLKVRKREYQQGDRVYLLDTATIKGRCKNYALLGKAQL